MTKYMYVFPEGGFNNICQIIWKCYEYSLKYNRKLVIDTRYICTFRDDIRKNYLSHHRFFGLAITPKSKNVLHSSCHNLRRRGRTT